MTTRLTRWLTTLDNFEAKMAQLPAVRRYGRLTRATGLVLEATGLQLPLGATCVIERQNGSETHEVESEVVGFNGQRLFLMPLEEVEGVLPGARVYAKNISAEGLQSGKQLPLGPALLGRVLDGSGKPLDGLPSPDTTETGALITPPFNPLQRTPIEHVLDTGVRPINALLTVGRGQRMGLFAGSGVGKSVLLGMMARYTRADVIVVGLIGERGREVKDFIENNQVLLGLALFLTFFIMSPVIDKIYVDAYQPFSEEKISMQEALEKGAQPLREFMLRQTREADLGLFARLANTGPLQGPEAVPMRILLPAYVTSELKTAFQIGFTIFIPFLIIDLVIASVLMALGMMMVPPATIALPFKLMLFVLVDGWQLLVGSLAQSFYS